LSECQTRLFHKVVSRFRPETLMGNVRFRSIAVIRVDSSSMAALGPIADVRHDPVSRMTGVEVIAEQPISAPGSAPEMVIQSA
jgi:hypothetical protein